MSDSDSEQSSLSESELDDYSDDEEGKKTYKIGSYHPVKIGEFYNNKYIVEFKLGWGHFSTVWLVSDITKEKNDKRRFYAMKVQKSSKNYTEAARDEIEILDLAHSLDKNENENLVTLSDHFIHNGINGAHICMIFDVLGDNLLTWIRHYRYKGLPFHVARKISYDILKGLKFLHDKCKVIHTDIKPENILFTPFVKIDYDTLSKLHDLPSAKILNENINLDVLKDSKYKDVDSLIAGLKIASIKDNDIQTITVIDNVDIVDNPITQIFDPAESKPIASTVPAAVDNKNLSKSQKKKQKIKAKKLAAKAASNYKVILSKPLVPPSEIIPDTVFAKIADLGNGCWINKHFTEDITTRQYRGPETLLGCNYNETVDVFSAACVIFELVTGDYLFDPQENTKDKYGRDDDHLALMMELMGPPPAEMLKKGKFVPNFFTSKGNLKRIKTLDPWDLCSVLNEKYKMPMDEATQFASFLAPMIEWDPKKRISAKNALKHEWLYMDMDKSKWHMESDE